LSSTVQVSSTRLSFTPCQRREAPSTISDRGEVMPPTSLHTLLKTPGSSQPDSSSAPPSTQAMISGLVMMSLSSALGSAFLPEGEARAITARTLFMMVTMGSARVTATVPASPNMACTRGMPRIAKFVRKTPCTITPCLRGAFTNRGTNRCAARKTPSTLRKMNAANPSPGALVISRFRILLNRSTGRKSRKISLLRALVVPSDRRPMCRMNQPRPSMISSGSMMSSVI